MNEQVYYDTLDYVVASKTKWQVVNRLQERWDMLNSELDCMVSKANIGMEELDAEKFNLVCVQMANIAEDIGALQRPEIDPFLPCDPEFECEIDPAQDEWEMNRQLSRGM